MIRFGGRTEDGRPLIGIALGHENLRRLKEGQPICVNAKTAGGPDAEILICAGRYAVGVMQEMKKIAEQTGTPIEDLNEATADQGFDLDQEPLEDPRHPLVCIESPFKPASILDLEPKKAILENIRYAQACMADSVKRGEYPLVPHLLYLQQGILSGPPVKQRETADSASRAWAERADVTAVYLDHGVTDGMKTGQEAAAKAGRPVIERWLFSKQN